MPLIAVPRYGMGNNFLLKCFVYPHIHMFCYIKVIHAFFFFSKQHVYIKSLVIILLVSVIYHCCKVGNNESLLIPVLNGVNAEIEIG